MGSIRHNARCERPDGHARSSTGLAKQPLKYDVILMTEQSAEPEPKKEDPTKHPIRQAIDKCLYRVLDIRTAATQFVPMAGRMHVNALERVIDGLSTHVSNLERDDKQTRIASIRGLFETDALSRRMKRSELSAVVEKGLFLTYSRLSMHIQAI